MDGNVGKLTRKKMMLQMEKFALAIPYFPPLFRTQAYNLILPISRRFRKSVYQKLFVSREVCAL